jgi:hypothetical protein
MEREEVDMRARRRKNRKKIHYQEQSRVKPVRLATFIFRPARNEIQ